MSAKPMNPQVSVCVAAYNVEKTLERALASLQAQTCESWEALVVDDGSKDGTLALAESLAAKDPRIRVIHKENGGYGAAMNRAMDEARGTWIAILEPDDYFEPDAFEQMLKVSRGADIVRAAYWRIIEGMRARCAYTWRVHAKSWPADIEEVYEVMMHHPSIWAAIYRRDFLVEKHIRFEEYPGAGWADNPFLVDTHVVARPKICYTDACVYDYFEDTPAEAVAFAKKNPLLPLERWNTMQDRIDAAKLGYLPGVKRAQIKRCLTYCNTALVANGESNQEMVDLIKKSFKRLDARAVLSDPQISPRHKQQFARLAGLAKPKLTLAEQISWKRELASQVVYRMRCCGIEYTGRTILGYVSGIFKVK